MDIIITPEFTCDQEFDEGDVVFISGHLDLPQAREFFASHYIPLINKAIAKNCKYVIGDARGIDAFAQEYLHEKGALDVVIYHAYDTPRHNFGKWPTSGNWANQTQKDAAMTRASARDIAVVALGRETRGTALNLLRRAKYKQAAELAAKIDIRTMTLDTRRVKTAPSSPPERKSVKRVPPPPAPRAKQASQNNTVVKTTADDGKTYRDHGWQEPLFQYNDKVQLIHQPDDEIKDMRVMLVVNYWRAYNGEFGYNLVPAPGEDTSKDEGQGFEHWENEIELA